MSTLQIIVLALIQGLTEFWPISSSGHLILIPAFTGWTDQGLAFDVAVHVGTLIAVLIYFRRELGAMADSWFRSLTGSPADKYARLAWGIIIASVPVAVVGLLASDLIAEHARRPLVVAATLSGFGVLLWVADRRGRRTLSEFDLSWRGALVVGFAQALALIPGTSRSGITMTACLLQGLDRAAAARFSFLLSVPAMIIAGGYEGLQLILSPAPVAWSDLALGVGVAAVTGYLCIGVLLRFLQAMGFAPFVIYRLLLAVAIVAVFGWR